MYVPALEGRKCRAQLARGDRGVDRACLVFYLGSYRPAAADYGDATGLLLALFRKCWLWRRFGNKLHRIHLEAGVVAAVELEDDYAGLAGIQPRHEQAFEDRAPGDHPDPVADIDVLFLEFV